MPSFAKDYQPVNQRESDEDSEKLDETSSTESDSQKFSHSYLSNYSSWVGRARWIPWVLILCLIISNWYALAKLKAKEIPNAVFCKVP
jgi:hypothetical protein